uniref:Uncharacterized protein n=1 Tax=Trichuris muris TaxID=70415 RepID=A0A5S6Q608_TRIMR
MDKLSDTEKELTNVYKTLLLTVKQLIRPEDKQLVRNVPLAIMKCITTMEFDVVKSAEMVNMAKRLTEELPKMEYADLLKQLKIYVDELRRRRDVVLSSSDAGTVEWIKLKKQSTVGTQQPKKMKSRDEMTAELLKATELLRKQMTKAIEWDRLDCRTTEKLERKIEILRNRLAASEGVSTSTGRCSMETPLEFASCGFPQIDNAVRELVKQCFPVGKTFGTRGRLAVRCPCHWEVKEAVVRANQEHSLGLSNKLIGDIAAKLAVDVVVAIKRKERSDFELYLQDTAAYSGLPESDDIASADENEQTADHPTEEEGPLHCEVDKAPQGKSSSQKERSKISDKMKMRVPIRRIVLSDPFIPITDLSGVKNRDEERVEECKNRKLAKFENAKGRKQSSLKAKAETPAQKSRKRQNAGCTGCAMDASENCSKMTHGNDRTGQSTCPSNSAKRRGRLPKAQSRRLSERTNPPLVEKHEGDIHSLNSKSRPQTRSSTCKSSTAASGSRVQSSPYGDHRQPTKRPRKRRQR